MKVHLQYLRIKLKIDAEELNKKGIATYDDELKIERNFKEKNRK